MKSKKPLVNKIFLLGNSGVGKSTLFTKLKETKNIQLKFVEDMTQDLNKNTFNNLPANEQQWGVILSQAHRDGQDCEELTIFDENLISSLIWARALVLKKKITYEEYLNMSKYVQSELRNGSYSKDSLFIILKSDIHRIRFNIKNRNRSLEHLNDEFKEIYDQYIEIYYDELAYLIQDTELNIITLEYRNDESYENDLKKIIKIVRKGGDLSDW